MINSNINYHVFYSFDNLIEIEEMEILKEAASQNILNDDINGRNDPLYKTLISVDS